MYTLIRNILLKATSLNITILALIFSCRHWVDAPANKMRCYSHDPEREEEEVSRGFLGTSRHHKYGQNLSKKEWVDMIFRKCHRVLRKSSGPTLSQHTLCGWADHSPWCERLYVNDSSNDDKPPCATDCCVPLTTPRALLGQSILAVLLFPIFYWFSKSFLLKKCEVQESQDDLMKGHAGIRE